MSSAQRQLQIVKMHGASTYKLISLDVGLELAHGRNGEL